MRIGKYVLTLKKKKQLLFSERNGYTPCYRIGWWYLTIWEVKPLIPIPPLKELKKFARERSGTFTVKDGKITIER